MCTTRTGVTTSLNNSIVTSTDLSNFLNKTTINLTYDLPQWEEINYASRTFWEVLVQNPNNSKPLLIRTNKFTNSSAGTYQIGTQDSAFVTICHTEPGSSIPVNLTIFKEDLAHFQFVGTKQKVFAI